MKRKLPRDFQNVPWITSDGALDMGLFPIDSILRQSLSEDPKALRSACALLSSMISAGRSEAGVYLLGLMRHHAEDLRKLAFIVESLRLFREEACAAALFEELRRVKSSNATRRYLDEVLRALAGFPLEMVRDRLDALAEDRAFSARMRAKFAAVLESMETREFW